MATFTRDRNHSQLERIGFCLHGTILGPGARFSKVPKSFRAQKATTKISNLKFTELYFSHVFNMNKFSLHAKFHAYTLLCFENSDN